LPPAPETVLTDTDLLNRAATGDAEAFRLFVTRHRAPVFRYLVALSHSSADAEDLLQETFLSAWRGAPSFRADASPKNWLFTIARNAAWHHNEKQAHMPPASQPIEELGLAAGWGASPEQAVLRAERAGLLAAALASLSPADCELLLLRDVEGLSGDAVAAMLQLTLPAMKTRLHRARLRLMAALAKENL
jgi:RNA polymerase sigma-70 factor, ECF subfamily